MERTRGRGHLSEDHFRTLTRTMASVKLRGKDERTRTRGRGHFEDTGAFPRTKKD